MPEDRAAAEEAGIKLGTDKERLWFCSTSTSPGTHALTRFKEQVKHGAFDIILPCKDNNKHH